MFLNSNYYICIDIVLSISYRGLNHYVEHQIIILYEVTYVTRKAIATLLVVIGYYILNYLNLIRF